MDAADAELLKAQYQLWGSILTASGTVLAAIIVGVFGTLIGKKFAREKDRQDKESQWRNHAIELSKLDMERKLKCYENNPSRPLRPSILDFLANYRDLLELDEEHPRDLFLKIEATRVTMIDAPGAPDAPAFQSDETRAASPVRRPAD